MKVAFLIASVAGRTINVKFDGPSFLKTQDKGIVPPGIFGWAANKLNQDQDWELDLYPGAGGSASAAGKDLEQFLAQKQRMLNAEAEKVHAMAVNRGFLKTKSPFGTMIKDSEFQVNVHVPNESAGDLQSQANAILKVENSRAASANADFVANKKALLAAEIGEMRRIVGGKSFLNPVVGPIADQTVC